MTPTAVLIAEQAIDAWNRGQRDRLLALCHSDVRPRVAELADKERTSLQPVEYRSVGDKVVVTMRAAEGDWTLVVTVRRSLIRALERYAPGDPLPDALLP